MPSIMKLSALTHMLTTLQSLVLASTPPAKLESTFGKLMTSLTDSLALLANNPYPHNDNLESVDIPSHYKHTLHLITTSFLTCLIDQSKYTTVRDFPTIKSYPHFKAYALYRLNQFAAAVALCETKPDSHANDLTIPLENIIAQASFRLGLPAAGLYYQDLLTKDPSDTEVLTNYLATAPPALTPADLLLHEATGLKQRDYDLLHNVAWCYANPRGGCFDMGKAQSVVDGAVEVARKACATPAEFHTETQSLEALRGYVQSLRGNGASAEAVLTGVNGRKGLSDDKALKCVIYNNLVGVREGGREKVASEVLASCARTLRELVAEGGERMLKNQVEDVEYNIGQLELFAGKEGGKKITDADVATRVTMMKFNNATNAEMIKVLDKPTTTREKLLLAQLYIDAGDGLAAADIIKALPPAISARPAGVKTVVDLMKEGGEREAAREYLAKMEKTMDGDGKVLVQIAGVEEMIALQNYTGAVECLEGLGSHNNDRVTALLVLATSFFDVDRAEGLASELALDVAEFDAASLENEPGLIRRKDGRERGVSLLSIDGGGEGAEKKRKEAAKNKERQAKRKEEYLDKLREAGKPVGNPDPERWLPKEQRSYNKRGKKKNKMTGGQGVGAGGGKDAAKLDMAARMADKGKKSELSSAHIVAGGGGKSSRRMPRK